MRAAIVFYHYGDSYLKALAQEVGTPLGRVFESYSHVRLLSESPSEADTQRSTVVAPATRSSLLEQLAATVELRGPVDVFVFAHGSPGQIQASDGPLSEADLRDGPQAENLRLVWQTNCYGASMATAWRARGAKTVLGTEGINFYPTRWPGFIGAWTAGKTAKASGITPVPQLLETATGAYLMADAAGRTKKWSGTVLQAATVMGESDAAQRYFEKCWPGVDWAGSGAASVERSSTYILGGKARTVIF